MAGDDLPGGWMLPGYEHLQLLGSGAGGHVWLALHLRSGTPVAVKYLAPDLHTAANFREAYRGEAVLLAALDSPHITRLYEYVEGPLGAAIVMEAVEGASLRELMKREGSAGSPEAALSVLKGSLLGLAAAHAAGVVHRDYKPANVLVTPDGVSKLVDFGIAARSGEAAPAAGTPLYMAPEQFHGAPAGPAADVYAATATFFECVTGERPFPGANAVELMAQHALGTIPDALAPEPVRALIRRGMAKAPQDRPGSAEQFLEELEAAAGAAYGEDWERRGQHKLATVAALLPLLLLGGVGQAAPSSTTSVATTVLGDGADVGTELGEVQSGGTGPDDGGGRGERKRRRRHPTRRAIGSGVGALLLVGAGVVAAAAYGSHTSGGSGGGGQGGQGPVALTGATTLVTLGSPTAPPSPSPTPSPSASTASATATNTATSSATATRTTASPTPSKTTASATASATVAPVIDSITFGTVDCVAGAPEMQATVNVTSNGGAGTVTFTWFYYNANGAPVDDPTHATEQVSAGKTQQSVSANSGSDFATAPAYNSAQWGVSVTSSPAAPTYPRPVTIAGCGEPPIQ